ncbi:MAG TPA: hypothetical protein VGL82_16195 [Bryobacteraceae bacterium]
MVDYVTVVSGLPRSGTSLMMQMLAAGGVPILADGVRSPDEDNPRGYFEYEPVRSTRRDDSWASRATGKAVKVIHLLLRDLPGGYRYRVILMRRPIQQVLASQRAMLDRLGRQGAQIPSETLAGLLQSQLDSAAAWVKAQPNFQIVEIQYQDCISQAWEVASSVSAFLDLRTEPMRMASVVEPALHRHK